MSQYTPKRDFPEFTYEIDGELAVITMCRPGQLNPFSQRFYQDVVIALEDANNDPRVKATIITGQGRFFSAGADVLDRPTSDLPPVEDHVRSLDYYKSKFYRSIHTLADVLASHSKILVFALNGPAIGIAAAVVAHADFVYATPKTYLHIPFAQLSLSCEGGSSLIFADRMGLGKANELLLYSKKMQVDEMKAYGLVNDIFPQEGFDSAVRNFVKGQVRTANPRSLVAIKTLLRKQYVEKTKAGLNDEVLFLSRRFASGEPQKIFADLKAKHSQKSKM